MLNNEKKKNLSIIECKRIHFIGIGGIGMSALARMFAHGGAVVSGSDSAESGLTQTLKDEGMHVRYEQVADNITNNKDIELVVYTDAMHPEHPELAAAQEASIPTMSYFEALGEVAKGYTLIAIAGTHGKTTTTAMTAQALIAAGLDPTVIVGSLTDFGDGKQTNFRHGEGKYFLVEACEYRRHFLHLHPHILAVTNIELDHPDYYKDLADVEDAFAELASQSENVLAQDSIQNEILRVPELTLPGEHNRQNAALVLAISEELKSEVQINIDTIKDSLSNFTGTWRRLQYKGVTKNGAIVYDDYAHHPTAIRVTLAALKQKHPEKKLLAIFEPHMYSRTKAFFTEFGNAFNDADSVIIVPIYAAREAVIEGISAESLSKEIEKHHNDVSFARDLQEVVGRVGEGANEDTVVILMGAGVLYEVIDTMMSH